MRFFLTLSLCILLFQSAFADELTVGVQAPLFTLKKQDGLDFQLKDRTGKWTVLYFYPKSETPGCTKQACSFRDNIHKIQKLNADVIGVSINSVEEQKGFKEHHQLNFDLLADQEGTVTELYGAKRAQAQMAQRWTFILDPKLIIRNINKDVDPVKDAVQVAAKIAELQKETRKQKK